MGFNDEMNDSASKRPNSQSSKKELYELRLAAERYDVVQDYKSNLIDRKTAMLRLGLSPAQFHRLCKRIAMKGSIEGARRLSRGRKVGAQPISIKLERIFSDKFDKHFQGAAATYAEVWRQIQAVADTENVACPSYHTVRRWIKENKKQRDIDRRRLGAEAAAQIYGAKPGLYPCKSPLEWVQLDHTLMDVLVVDSEDPTVIIGRPWVSFAIDVFTRAVVGFHIALLPPSSMTVAMLIANAVLPKQNLLSRLNMRTDMLPMHGVMKAIHMDNAKEFWTELLHTACAMYGIGVHHRDIGKKHQGGHVERLIGTMMTTRVHFYRGTTYSNTIERRGQSSEKKAALNFSEVRELLVHSINTYHGTVHSALKMSPLDKWNEYYKSHDAPKTIAAAEADFFRIDFYPEEVKKIHHCGIKILGRVFHDRCLNSLIGEKFLVKYDPYDTSQVKVLIADSYVDVPCSQNISNRDPDYEVYRYQRSKKGIRPGTITSASSRQSVVEMNEIQQLAVTKTERAKRRKNKEAREQHFAYKEMVSPGMGTVVAAESDQVKVIAVPKQKIFVTVDSTVSSKIDFSTDAIIFDADF